MKLKSFIKAYLIALNSIESAVSKWKFVYLGYADIDDDTVTFVFSNGSEMKNGDLGISATVSTELAECGICDDDLSLLSSVYNNSLGVYYKDNNVIINDAGRVILLLEKMISSVKEMYEEDCESLHIKDITFDFDKDLANIKLSNSTVCTDGILCLV